MARRKIALVAPARSAARRVLLASTRDGDAIVLSIRRVYSRRKGA